MTITAVVPSTENMPSGRAIKPGDIVTAMNGKTIEINNTDAEGRLILADALVYAVEQGAERIVDLATLTGAIIVALGSTYAGLFSNDDDWCGEVEAACDATGELGWRLPLHPEYFELTKGQYADLTNASDQRKATSIYAAEFLRQFVGDVPWVHMDIAGTAWGLGRPYVGKGASGFGVRTLIELAHRAAPADLRAHRSGGRLAPRAGPCHARRESPTRGPHARPAAGRRPRHDPHRRFDYRRGEADARSASPAEVIRRRRGLCLVAPSATSLYEARARRRRQAPSALTPTPGRRRPGRPAPATCARRRSAQSSAAGSTPSTCCAHNPIAGVPQRGGLGRDGGACATSPGGATASHPGPPNGFTLDLIAGLERFGDRMTGDGDPQSRSSRGPRASAAARPIADVGSSRGVVDYGGLFHGGSAAATRSPSGDHRGFRPRLGRPRARPASSCCARSPSATASRRCQLACQWNLAHDAVACCAPTLIQEGGWSASRSRSSGASWPRRRPRSC